MNKAAIVERIIKDARTVSTWSRMRGFCSPTVYMLLAGRMRPTTPTSVKIINQLRADGYLFDEDLTNENQTTAA